MAAKNPPSVSDSLSSRVARALKKAASRKYSGFTLVELIVVITILAVLATVGFLALSGYSQDAKDASVKANVRSIYSAIAAESAVTNNSPRHYVNHEAGAALSDGTVVFVDGNPVTLTGGTYGTAGTNYSAWNPDWAKLKLNPDKFRLSSLGSRLEAFLSTAEAAYDSKLVSVWAVDAALVPTANGRNRSVSLFQVAGTATVTKMVSVAGNFPPPTPTQVTLGAAAGLVKAPTGTGALVDGETSAGTAGNQPATASQYPGCDTPDIYLTGSNQYWAACNAGPGALTAYTSQSVALADATATGGPTVSQKAYRGAYYQWGRNADVTTGTTVAGPLAPATAASETRFIVTNDSPYDWMTLRNHDLWGGTGSTVSTGTFASLGSPAAMRGPCAEGYHVPTLKEWCDAIVAVSPTQNGWAAMVCDAPWHVEATANKFMTTLRLPLAGSRNSGSATFHQGTGRYWTSSPSATLGYYVGLSSTLGVSSATTNYRAEGFSVRCLKN